MLCTKLFHGMSWMLCIIKHKIRQGALQSCYTRVKLKQNHCSAHICPIRRREVSVRLGLLLACSCLHPRHGVVMIGLAESHVDSYTEQDEEERTSCRNKVPYAELDPHVTVAVLREGLDSKHHCCQHHWDIEQQSVRQKDRRWMFLRAAL